MSGAFSYFQRTGYIRSPLANGLGRFVQQCSRMTIKFCKSSGTSRGVRDFIERDLVDFARANPGMVVYLKPRRHRTPVAVAEYLNGHREWISLYDCEGEEVGKWLYHLRSCGGTPEQKFKNYHRTDTPSIQGPWTPFTHKAPEKNIITFPHEDYSRPSNLPPSTTEILLEMYENQKQSQNKDN